MRSRGQLLLTNFALSGGVAKVLEYAKLPEPQAKLPEPQAKLPEPQAVDDVQPEATKEQGEEEEAEEEDDGLEEIKKLLTKVKPSGDEELMQSFAAACLRREPDQEAATVWQWRSTRARSLGALWSFCATLKSYQAARLWAREDIQTVLVASLSVTEPTAVRSIALGALWGFASFDENRPSMWHHTELQKALFVAAAPKMTVTARKEGDPLLRQQTTEVRTRALETLAALALANENQVSMWENGNLSTLVMDAAQESAPVKLAAQKILIRLSLHPSNQEPMTMAGVALLLDEDCLAQSRLQG